MYIDSELHSPHNSGVGSGVARGGLRGLEHPLSQTKKKKEDILYLVFFKNKNYRKYTC